MWLEYPYNLLEGQTYSGLVINFKRLLTTFKNIKYRSCAPTKNGYPYPFFDDY
jgi:hypothetical protein